MGDSTSEYWAPALKLGTELVSGYRIIAAIREPDQPGFLPGLHVVTAVSSDGSEYVTWLLAWQADIPTGVLGKWVASAGHYFRVTAGSGLPDSPLSQGTGPDAKAQALADMLSRYRG